MWLIILALSAAIATAIWYAKDDGTLKMNILCMVLWGATIMVFVDHTLGYLMEGGEYFDVSLDATLLGIVLVIFALIIWEIVLLVEDPKGKLWGR